MSDIAIRVENLSKQYCIGQHEAAYKTLRESIMNLFGKRDGNPETIWALKDVSFRVKRGEVVGIIGRNGAGKSTLLKILSRVTEPTEGHAFINGRVGSLLEVGTGFHPELTGRENIFLNGAILGMRKAEIERKFAEIVAFAEIEKFIDTPVKRYSSGMYVRLAFAVAAHLEPEILLVDEVLAVGDIAFQRKCLGKIDDIARGGRTVLFVSHNMGAIQKFCHTGVLLDSGEIRFIGDVAEAIYHYQESMKEIIDIPQNVAGVRILSTRVNTSKGGTAFSSDGDLVAEMDFYTEYSLRSCYLNIVIEDPDGKYMIHSRTDVEGLMPKFDAGLHRVRVTFPRLGIRVGLYTLWFRLYLDNEMQTQMIDSDRVMLRVDGPLLSGLVPVPCHWSWERIREPCRGNNGHSFMRG